MNKQIQTRKIQQIECAWEQMNIPNKCSMEGRKEKTREQMGKQITLKKKQAKKSQQISKNRG